MHFFLFDITSTLTLKISYIGIFYCNNHIAVDSNLDETYHKLSEIVLIIVESSFIFIIIVISLYPNNLVQEFL